MPHFILEYSANLEDDIDVAYILKELRDAAVATGLFPLAGIRLRAVCYEDYLIADGKADYAFVHLTGILGGGRSLAVKKAAGQQVFDTLAACLADSDNSRLLAISYYMYEADPVLSYKQNNIHLSTLKIKHKARHTMPLTDPLAILIIISAFLAALVSSAFAVGGGFIMIAVLSNVLPMQYVVPLHSPMMLGLSLGRTFAFWRDIQWRIVIPFASGSIIGAFSASPLYFHLPAFLIALVIALFILLATWVPAITWHITIPRPFFCVGVLHSFFSTLFSFGGLFQPIMLRQAMSRFKIVATLAAGLLFMNLLKISAYTLQGFDYSEWLVVIIAAILAGIPGAIAGRQLLHCLSENKFRFFFRLAMTAFAIKLLYLAWVLY